MSTSCMLHRVVKCIIEGPIDKSIIEAFNYLLSSQLSASENHRRYWASDLKFLHKLAKMCKFNVEDTRSHPSSSCRKWSASKMKCVITLSWIFTRKTRIKANHIFAQLNVGSKQVFLLDCSSWEWTVLFCSRKATECQKNCQNLKKKCCQDNEKQKFHWVTESLLVYVS